MPIDPKGFKSDHSREAKAKRAARRQKPKTNLAGEPLAEASDPCVVTLESKDLPFIPGPAADRQKTLENWCKGTWSRQKGWKDTIDEETGADIRVPAYETLPNVAGAWSVSDGGYIWTFDLVEDAERFRKAWTSRTNKSARLPYALRSVSAGDVR